MSDWSRLYPTIRKQRKAHESRKFKQNISHPRLLPSLENEDARFKTLELRIKFLLDKYRGDNATIEKILGELNVLRVNITIAKELGDKKAITKRLKEYNDFLNQF